MRSTFRFCLAVMALGSLSACGEDGPPPPPPESCQGIATACSLINPYECDYVAGCYESGVCSGSPRACSTHYSSSSCNDQNNCYWSSNTCLTGVATTCSIWSIDTYCYDYGCNFNRTCTGVAYDCSLLDDSYSCDLQPGCTWQR